MAEFRIISLDSVRYLNSKTSPSKPSQPVAKIKHSTNPLFNPKIPSKENRPRCSSPECARPCDIISTRKDGSPLYRKICKTCHSSKTASKHGLKNLKEVVAMNAGFDNPTDYANSTHPYRRHRKDFCENIDGRLGYVCDSVIRMSAQLEVDHRDGNHLNNDPNNLQTLCKMCHTFKTYANKDYATPGRKTRKNQLTCA